MSCRQIAVRLNEEGVLTPARYAGLTISNPGPYSGKWSSERISDMLQNETYIGNMVQGRSVKVNYKSKKCLKQAREKWVIVENTHDAIIDVNTFNKVKMLIDSRTHTRSRTYDFLLKGLIYCHECGYPLAILNRKNAKGEDTLYFVCRTYQRFTKDSICTGHIIKEKIVTDAVIEKVKEVCSEYLKQEKMLPIAKKAIAKVKKSDDIRAEIRAIQSKSESLTANLDKMYMDKLNGILSDTDFERIYKRVKQERMVLDNKLTELKGKLKNPVKGDEEARELADEFVNSAFLRRENLVSLIERIELTKDKNIIIKFHFAELEKTS